VQLHKAPETSLSSSSALFHLSLVEIFRRGQGAIELTWSGE
jgi:hypothetical protein